MKNIFDDYKTKKDRIEKEYFFLPSWVDVCLFIAVALFLANALTYIML